MDMYDEIIVVEDVIKVEMGNYYLFTSPDVPGMFVGSNDRQKAWDDIPVVAKTLMEASTANNSARG